MQPQLAVSHTTNLPQFRSREDYRQWPKL